MKTFVITIMENTQSYQVAKRCIKSAQYYGIKDVNFWKAKTPADNPKEILDSHFIDQYHFDEIYSKTDNCKAAFCSHLSLWEKSIELNEPIIICEHDAIFTSQLPPNLDMKVTHICNIGHPSYGKWLTPNVIGVQKLMSKQYFPGAHAYVITPVGAKELINSARAIGGQPTDVFINNGRFPFVQELYPWVAEAKDSFTTIQKEAGCQAKHGYGEAYAII